ncbi:MAG: MORN repeat-containing protein [Ferruginibacter sp.]
MDKREGIGSDYEGGKLVYEGEFKYDKRNGTGVFIKADGTKQKALWLDGVNKEVDPASAPKPEFVLTGIDDSFDGGNINKWDMYSGGLRAEMKSSVLKITSLQSGSGFIRKELPGKLSFDKKDDWAFEVNATKTVGDNFASWSIGWYNGDLLVNNQGIVLFVFPKDQHIQTKLIH